MTVTERPTASEPRLGAVDDVLRAFIDDAITATPAAASIWEEVRRASVGGKQLRPRLLLAAHEALGGTGASAAARAAAGFELLHTAFLIHDDVIDRDWSRRGEPNVAAAFRATALARGRRPEIAEHFGTSAAIIAGDLAVAGAVELVTTSSADPGIRATLAGIVSGAVSATAAGELMDVELASADLPDLDAVLAMYEAKTGVYTFCAPLQAGAVLAGAAPEIVSALGSAGLALGVAYQVADDLLGTFGDPAVTGKSVVSDAREGKQTVLATLARTNGGLALPIPASTPDDEIAARWRAAIERSGARAAAIELAAARAEEARGHLEAVPEPLRAALAPLLADLVDRVA
jgi:geranylgeranyl diphosphate synthase, type II